MERGQLAVKTGRDADRYCQNTIDDVVAEKLRIFVWRVNWFDRYGRHIFSPNEGDLSYSARTIFLDNIKMVKARQTISSSEPFEKDGRTFCLCPS